MINMAVKEIRSDCKMTQKEFADFTGIPLDTLKSWESGKSNPPDYVIDFLRISVEMVSEAKDSEGRMMRLKEYSKRLKK